MSDLLDTAEVLGLNVSHLWDTELREAERQLQERRWRAEHADFIAAHKVAVEAEGLPLEAWRTF